MKSTKELARELGLLKKRAITKRLSECSSIVQQFKYLIVIDFESTCWENAKFNTQEIIEFPAVLLNTETGEIESEFHHYVQPQEHPVLSQFCTKLTGITQDKVEDGVPIFLCLKRFCQWLNKLYTEKGITCHGTETTSSIQPNTTCATWSDWDLGVCLHYECKRKQLTKPLQMNVWIDLRATYRRFYDRKPNGLNGALQDLGIEFQGREHSGIDDARNTAKLAYRMIRDGCIMKNTKTMKDHVRSVSLPATIFPSTFIGKPPEKKESKDTVAKEVLKSGERNNNDELSVSDYFCVKKNSTMEHSSLSSKDSVCMRQTSSHKGNCDNLFTPSMCNNDKGNHGNRNNVEHKNMKQEISSNNMKVRVHSDNVNCDNKNVDNEFKVPLSCNSGTVFVKPDSNSCIKRKLTTGCNESLSSCNPVSKYPRMSSKSNFSSSDIYVDTTTPKHDSRKLVQPSNIGLKIMNGNRPTFVNNQIKSWKSDVANKKVNKSVLSKTTGPAHSTLGSGKENLPLKSFNQSKLTSYQNNSTMTPRNTMIGSTMKITPPLCKCGRRSRRRMVQSPGQNTGRFFFTCVSRKMEEPKKGCDFFKWEISAQINCK
ncbi:ERI1 exoribonuclease 2 [Mactra antiquata]